MIAPFLGEVLQDNFAQNGTLNIAAPGRFDWRFGGGGVGDSLGDTLIVHGADGGAEVHVQFSISPGPGVDPVALAAFLGSVTFEETKDGEDWYSAQMDTAEFVTTGAIRGRWMTARIEGSPGFVGTDSDTDPSDLDPFAHETSL